MNTIDIIIIILFIVGMVYGAKKGVIKQITSIGGIIIGIIACRLMGGYATELLIKIAPEAKSFPLPETTTSILANILLFVFVFISVSLAGTLVKSAVRSLNLGIMDRISGAIFCVFKFFIGLSLILNLWFIISPKSGVFNSSTLLDGVVFRLTLDLAPSLLNSKLIPTATEALQTITT